MNPNLLPIYLFSHYVVFYLFSLKQLTLMKPFEAFMEYFLAFAKSFSLVNGIFVFKHHITHSQLAQESIMGQWVVGILSATGSSLIYKWLIAAWEYQLTSTESKNMKTRHGKTLKKELFPFPGSDFQVAALMSSFIILLTHPFWYLQLQFLIQQLPMATFFTFCLHEIGFPDSLPLSKGDLSVLTTLLLWANLMLKSNQKEKKI
jgi:hypothetical protein